MLKIKENIDLKELEKYGFEHHRLIYTKDIKKAEYDEAYRTIHVEEMNRRISISPQRKGFYSFNVDNELDVVYDLIKDGLVEKV